MIVKLSIGIQWDMQHLSEYNKNSSKVDEVIFH